MTPTEREAAEQRLVEAYAKAATKYANRPPNDKSLWQILARIAIEQAVVPVWRKAPSTIGYGGYEKRPLLPWDAVCASIDLPPCPVCGQITHGEYKPAAAPGER